MPADPKLDQIQQLANEAKTADIAEDADYEAKIAALTLERDELKATIAGSLATLQTIKGAVTDAIAELETRIAVLEQL